jgi:hypothetical protein
MMKANVRDARCGSVPGSNGFLATRQRQPFSGQDERASLRRELKGWDRSCARLRDLTTVEIAAWGPRIDRRDRRAADQIADAIRKMIDDGLSISSIHIGDDGSLTVRVVADQRAAELVV